MNTLTNHFNIGEHEGIVLNDYSDAHTADELIINPNIEELEQLAQEFAFSLNEIPVDYNNLLIQTGNQKVLVDAGIPRPMGNLFKGLEELKIDPGDIDTVVITHSDMDHIGGILDEEGEISFPNSRYIMLEEYWQYWSSEERCAELARLNNWAKEKAEFAWETYSKIRDLMISVKPGEEFIPGFRLFPALGHRYDHSILKVTSSDELLMHISDAIAHPLFMAKQDWYSTYDANPAQVVETKKELLRICASENALVFGAHFPFPGLGYVQQDHDRWNWQTIN
ncbi:MAG: MBL fold metallo-hydrolase [Chloroflexi bacterium]|nr:MBL fold metallo-hydrolase [Chloroflexota bacterium]